MAHSDRAWTDIEINDDYMKQMRPKTKPYTLLILRRTSKTAEPAGIGIFDAEVREVDRIMSEDPAVTAGLMTYTLHRCVGFPGDGLTG